MYAYRLQITDTDHNPTKIVYDNYYKVLPRFCDFGATRIYPLENDDSPSFVTAPNAPIILRFVQNLCCLFPTLRFVLFLFISGNPLVSSTITAPEMDLFQPIMCADSNHPRELNRDETMGRVFVKPTVHDVLCGRGKVRDSYPTH